MENNKYTNCYKIKWWDKEEVPCYEVSAEEYNKQLAYCIKNYHHNKRWYWESDASYFTKCQYQWKEFNTGLLLSLIDEDENPIIEIIVSEADMGKVIGKSGKTAKALRTLIQATAYNKNIKRVKINIDSF